MHRFLSEPVHVLKVGTGLQVDPEIQSVSPCVTGVFFAAFVKTLKVSVLGFRADPGDVVRVLSHASPPELEQGAITTGPPAAQLAQAQTPEA